jgi:hypothetical protein
MKCTMRMTPMPMTEKLMTAESPAAAGDKSSVIRPNPRKLGA